MCDVWRNGPRERRGKDVMEAKRVAIYLRVSKSDGSQTVDNQRPECERAAAMYGTTVKVYEEQMSAALRRPAYDAMMVDARAGMFDVVVIWALDRFGRSMLDNITDITALDALNVGVVSIQETWLNTTSPVRGLLVAIFSWVAEQERKRLIERTKAGQRRAREQGIHIGRPTIQIDMARAKALLAAGATQAEAAKLCNVSRTAFQDALKRERAA